MIPLSYPSGVMDPEAAAVAAVYAEALLDAAGPDRCEETVEQLGALRELLDSVDGARALLSDVRIRADRREEMVRRIFSGRIDDTLAAFLGVLTRHGRMNLLGPVVACVRDQWRGRQSVLEVDVVTAAPLTDDLRERIGALFAEEFRARVALRERVDPSLLGGMVVQVGDKRYDASVSRKLGRLRDRLVGGSGPAPDEA